jgi:formamidopyrimidine-DNA glycosylase
VPELPEVETVRAVLEPLVTGRTFEEVRIHDPRLTRPFDPDAVGRELEGQRVTAVERRGKYLVLRFKSGRVLLVHLRMTGSFRRIDDGAPEPSHVRASLTLDDGTRVVYRDVRRFGTWLVVEAEELEAYLGARVGAEPLERGFGPAALAARLGGRRAPVKAAILDRRTVAGLGNIYADEALWRARVHPLRPAGDLRPDEVRRLHSAVRRALQIGIERQGATLRDYAQPDGRRGGMQLEFRVYGREGEPCTRCGTPIEKSRIGGRGTWYCPQCQRS